MSSVKIVGLMIEAGFLVIDKPAGLTSQRVVGKIKQLMRCRKVGHTGTLDPLATGVLPIALNRATRLIQYLDEDTKIYSGEIELGIESDTLDRDGEVIARYSGSLDFDKEQIEAVLLRYLGQITQTAPVYSAIKSKGRPLYAYARAGVEVKPPERRIRVDEFTLLSYKVPLIAFRVVCSKGTYVRSLAADVGRDLGCGGRIWSLRREASGRFNLEQAISFEVLSDMILSGEEPPLLSSLEVLDHLPRLVLLDAGLQNRVAHGMVLPRSEWPESWSEHLTGIRAETEIMLLDEADNLLALARLSGCGNNDSVDCGLRMSRVMKAAGSD